MANFKAQVKCKYATTKDFTSSNVTPTPTPMTRVLIKLNYWKKLV